MTTAEIPNYSENLIYGGHLGCCGHLGFLKSGSQAEMN
jgi:hypothetical protein